jgi:hypothetical protein
MTNCMYGFLQTRKNMHKIGKNRAGMIQVTKIDNFSIHRSAQIKFDFLESSMI